MKTVIKRFFAGALLISVVTLSGLATIVLFPEPLFAHKLEYGYFKVYSNDKPDKEIEVVLDDALALVKRSELFDDDYRYDIFLSYNSFFNKIDDTLLGEGPTARATDNNIVIKVALDSRKNLLYPTFYQHCQANLTNIIAHEMIHCLQENKYGKLKFNPFRHPAYWKLEGYPEYISRHAQLSNDDYDFIKEIERYVDVEAKLTDIWMDVDEGGCKSPKHYYKSRLMIEYLMNIKHLSYDRILTDTISEDSIFIKMLKWKDELNAGKPVSNDLDELNNY